jgi:hypothetical protein
VKRPTFDSFHPNADESNNACGAAEAGDFAKACTWLNEAQNGLEYPEAKADYDKATTFVLDEADEAGVALGPTSATYGKPGHDDWQVYADQP